MTVPTVEKKDNCHNSSENTKTSQGGRAPGANTKSKNHDNMSEQQQQQPPESHRISVRSTAHSGSTSVEKSATTATLITVKVSASGGLSRSSLVDNSGQSANGHSIGSTCGGGSVNGGGSCAEGHVV